MAVACSCVGLLLDLGWAVAIVGVMVFLVWFGVVVEQGTGEMMDLPFVSDSEVWFVVQGRYGNGREGVLLR